MENFKLITMLEFGSNCTIKQEMDKNISYMYTFQKIVAKRCLEYAQQKANLVKWYDTELFQQAQECTVEMLGKEGAFLIFGNSGPFQMLLFPTILIIVQGINIQTSFPIF